MLAQGNFHSKARCREVVRPDSICLLPPCLALIQSEVTARSLVPFPVSSGQATVTPLLSSGSRVLRVREGKQASAQQMERKPVLFAVPQVSRQTPCKATGIGSMSSFTGTSPGSGAKAWLDRGLMVPMTCAPPSCSLRNFFRRASDMLYFKRLIQIPRLPEVPVPAPPPPLYPCPWPHTTAPDSLQALDEFPKGL